MLWLEPNLKHAACIYIYMENKGKRMTISIVLPLKPLALK